MTKKYKEIFMTKCYYFCLLIFCSNLLLAANHPNSAPETISSKLLKDFQSNPPKVKNAIELGLQLAGRNLVYQYGSANPAAGGMDCSGAMHYLLTKLNVKSVPRSSNDIYNWIKKEGVFYSTPNADFTSKDFSHLKPGDLLFWSGTYNAPGNAYVTHVMMYIGKNIKGEPLMIGSSDGRTYKGRQIYGVSVFDFLLPPSSSKTKFVGYSCIPQVSCDF